MLEPCPKGIPRAGHETSTVTNPRPEIDRSKTPSGGGLWAARVQPRLAMAWRLFPVKPAGLVILGGATLLLVYFGLMQQDLILLMTSMVVAVVAVLDILLVCLTAWLTHWWWREAESGLPAEISPLLVNAPGRLRLLRRPPWLPLVEVNWRWLAPRGVEVTWGTDAEGAYEEFVFRQRCLVDGIEREFEICDVLGFASIRLRRKQALLLQVLPAPLPLDRRTFVTAFHGGDDISDPRGEAIGDRVDMRQYAAGDPPKLLLWKLYARTGRLMVRQPERAIAPTPRTCAYLVAGKLDETSAGLMRTILESGLLGTGWRFGADGNEGFCSKVEEALMFLARSGNLSQQNRMELGLRAYLQQAARDGYNGCLVALPSLPGKWIEEIRNAARVSGIQLTFVASPAGLLSSQKARPVPDWWKKVSPMVFSVPLQFQSGEPEEVLKQLAGVGRERWIYLPAQHGFVRYGGKASA